ncbi:type II toxin-antitoxin system PemK/MazF family toxin [Phytomonospora sp. NPDC050363]|uniref:type II toxin-antitoxin system PemK/MazF family toxin n=1 Tax=Phytomonospora sp. NPDC050363 TaxID=3155642 RepID=UPI0034046442
MGAAVYRPEIDIDGVKSRVLTDQLFSIAPERLGDVKGGLDSAEIQDLDRALLLKLGLF